MPSLWSASARTITFNYRSDRSMRNRTILRETLCFVFQPFTGCFVRRSTHLVNFLPTQRDATPSSFARLSPPALWPPISSRPPRGTPHIVKQASNSSLSVTLSLCDCSFLFLLVSLDFIAITSPPFFFWNDRSVSVKQLKTVKQTALYGCVCIFLIYIFFFFFLSGKLVEFFFFFFF